MNGTFPRWVIPFFHISTILILIPAASFDTKSQFTNFPIYEIYKDLPVEIARENGGDSAAHRSNWTLY